MKTKLSITSFFVSLAVSSSVMAVTSSPTPTVKGHAPVYTAPVISYSDVNNNKVVDTGDLLTATEGSFSDADGDTKVAPTWRWSNGTEDLGSNDSYTIRAADLGKIIQLFATPHTDASITDPADGDEVGGGSAGPIGSSSAIAVVAGDEVLSVSITGIGVSGFPLVGEELTAQATCTATCGPLNYQWQIEDAIGSGVYIDITGATSATYTPTKDNQKHKIQAVVNKQ